MEFDFTSIMDRRGMDFHCRGTNSYIPGAQVREALTGSR
jgi:hypothetical protein